MKFNDPDSVLWNWSEFRDGNVGVKFLYVFLFPLVPLVRYLGFKMLGQR